MQSIPLLRLVEVAPGRFLLARTRVLLAGIDHERLTYRFQGRDFNLTDVAGCGQ
jgi:hypothetical protein